MPIIIDFLLYIGKSFMNLLNYVSSGMYIDIVELPTNDALFNFVSTILFFKVGYAKKNQKDSMFLCLLEFVIIIMRSVQAECRAMAFTIFKDAIGVLISAFSWIL